MIMDIDKIKSMKGAKKIVVLTAYDYNFSRLIDGTADMILVGDSMANVIYGAKTTREITMDVMLYHVKAVSRGASGSMIVADMPFGSYSDPENAVMNARKLMDAGAHAVKPEGKPNIVKALVSAHIPVMAHVGLLPQTAERFQKAGKEEEEALKILNMAIEMDEAGAFCIVVESVPEDLAGKITGSVGVPTIGIGAGKRCDGQVLVSYDMLGLHDDVPGFVRRYASLGEDIKAASRRFAEDVRAGNFP